MLKRGGIALNDLSDLGRYLNDYFRVTREVLTDQLFFMAAAKIMNAGQILWFCLAIRAEQEEFMAILI